MKTATFYEQVIKMYCLKITLEDGHNISKTETWSQWCGSSNACILGLKFFLRARIFQSACRSRNFFLSACSWHLVAIFPRQKKSINPMLIKLESTEEHSRARIGRAGLIERSAKWNWRSRVRSGLRCINAQNMVWGEQYGLSLSDAVDAEATRHHPE